MGRHGDPETDPTPSPATPSRNHTTPQRQDRLVWRAVLTHLAQQASPHRERGGHITRLGAHQDGVGFTGALTKQAGQGATRTGRNRTVARTWLGTLPYERLRITGDR